MKLPHSSLPCCFLWGSPYGCCMFVSESAIACACSPQRAKEGAMPASMQPLDWSCRSSAPQPSRDLNCRLVLAPQPAIAAAQQLAVAVLDHLVAADLAAAATS